MLHRGEVWLASLDSRLDTEPPGERIGRGRPGRRFASLDPRFGTEPGETRPVLIV